MTQERIIAVGLLTDKDLERLGDTFTRLWPVEEAPCFDDLVKAIDEADQQLKEGGEDRAFRCKR